MLKEIKFFISVVSLVSLVSLVDIADSANNTPVHLCGLDWKVVGNKFRQYTITLRLPRLIFFEILRAMHFPTHHFQTVATVLTARSHGLVELVRVFFLSLFFFFLDLHHLYPLGAFGSEAKLSTRSALIYVCYRLNQGHAVARSSCGPCSLVQLHIPQCVFGSLVLTFCGQTLPRQFL